MIFTDNRNTSNSLYSYFLVWRGLSRKFCSTENFGPGPIFSGKIIPGGTIFSGLVLKILFLYTLLLKINCNKLYDARRGKLTRSNCLIFNPTIDSHNSNAHMQRARGDFHNMARVVFRRGYRRASLCLQN